MTNFYRSFDLPVTINNGMLVLPTTTVKENGNGLKPGATFNIKQSQYFKVKNPSNYYSGTYYGYNPLNSNVKLSPNHAGTASVDNQTNDWISSDCEYKFATDQYMTATIYWNGLTISSDGDGMRIYVFKTNSVAKDYNSDVLTDTYGVDVYINPDDDTEAVIKNWGYQGINFKNSVVPVDNYGNFEISTTLCWVDAILDYEEETVTIERQYAGGDILIDNNADVGYGTLDSGWSSYTAYWYTDPYYMPAIQDSYTANTDDDIIVGRITPRDSYHKNVDENHWSKSHGGQLETWHKMNFEFDNMAMWGTWDNFETTEMLASVDKTVYETPYDYEYTHDTALDLTNFDQDATRFGFAGSVTARTKSRHVESYDLYIVPGSHKNISTVTTHHETGIAGAQLIASGLKETGRSANGSEIEIPYTIIDRPDAISYSPSRDYTLFLKTNYNNGLHPTYHAMTLAANIPTGIIDLDDYNPALKVRAVDGGVLVEGCDGTVEVYGVAGQQMFAGQADGVISLDGGVYIVRIGNRTWKVNVR